MSAPSQFDHWIWNIIYTRLIINVSPTNWEKKPTKLPVKTTVFIAKKRVSITFHIQHLLAFRFNHLLHTGISLRHICLWKRENRKENIVVEENKVQVVLQLQGKLGFLQAVLRFAIWFEMLRSQLNVGFKIFNSTDGCWYTPIQLLNLIIETDINIHLW